jgi:hypothetical protein
MMYQCIIAACKISMQNCFHYGLHKNDKTVGYSLYLDPHLFIIFCISYNTKCFTLIFCTLVVYIINYIQDNPRWDV